MKNFVQDGKTIRIVAGAAITSGEVVAVGDLVGVAINDCANTEECVLHLEGVYAVTKKAAVAFAQGEIVYFEASEASDVVGKVIGYAHEAAAGGDATVNVKFDR